MILKLEIRVDSKWRIWKHNNRTSHRLFTDMLFCIPI